eukprot:5236755-Amphidinium_carterae.1
MWHGIVCQPRKVAFRFTCKCPWQNKFTSFTSTSKIQSATGSSLCASIHLHLHSLSFFCNASRASKVLLTVLRLSREWWSVGDSH